MRKYALFLLAAAIFPTGCATRLVHRDNPCGFLAFKTFNNWEKSPGAARGEWVLTSPVLDAPIDWDQLVVSWNVPPGVYLNVQARAVYPEHPTKFYTMSLWSDDPSKHPRESVGRQRDEDGAVMTDTLMLKRLASKVQLRMTVGGTDPVSESPVKFLGVSFCNTKMGAVSHDPDHAAWGKVIPVPQRRQGEYEGGGGWCSPTSLSMVLAYWAERLHRPELNHTVPEVAAAVNDGNFDGTGNWPFNTAYAGSFKGMRAYVTRLSDISELEKWIAAGIPPIMSVSSYLLRSPSTGPDEGHLIVCVGFTKDGDVVVNDPGVSVKRNLPARRVYPRQRVIDNWKKSHNTVYIIYPIGAKTPRDRDRHWFDGS